MLNICCRYKNLKILADIQGKINREQIRLAMQQVGLDSESKKRVGTYSLGMKQRLGIAQAIMEDPEIIILDEPFNGLDKQGVIEIRQFLLSLKQQNKTILLSCSLCEDKRMVLFASFYYL